MAESIDQRQAGSDASEDEDLLVLRKSKTPIWPFVLALVVAALGGGGYAFFRMRQPVQLRVVVALDVDGYFWQGSTLSAQLSDGLAQRLNKLGFECVDGGNPEVVDQLAGVDSAREAGKLLKAGFVVTGKLRLTQLEHPLAEPFTELRLSGPIEIAAHGEDLTKVGDVSGYSGARQSDQANELLGKSMSDMVFDRALGGLLQHRAVQSILHGEDAVARGQLSAAKTYVELRDSAVSGALREYEKLYETRRSSEGAGQGRVYHSKFRSSDQLAGASQHGVLIKSLKIEPFFHPDQKLLGYFRGLDNLYWLGSDGKEVPIATAYNLYGYAGASPDGSHIAYIEDLFGWAKTITVATRGGEPRRIKIDGSHRYNAPRFSRDSEVVAAFDRACARCQEGLLVLSVKDGAEVFSVEGGLGATVANFGFSQGRDLYFIYRLPPGPSGEPAMEQLRKVSTKVPGSISELVLQLETGEQLADAAPGEGGRWLAFGRSSDDGKHLAVLDTETQKLSTFDVSGGVYSVQASPTQRAVVFERNGRIMHFHLDTKVLTELSDGGGRDRYPSFSGDGKRVFYESLASDPNFPRERGVSAIISVEAP